MDVREGRALPDDCSVGVVCDFAFSGPFLRCLAKARGRADKVHRCDRQLGHPGSFEQIDDFEVPDASHPFGTSGTAASEGLEFGIVLDPRGQTKRQTTSRIRGMAASTQSGGSTLMCGPCLG